MSLEAVFCIYPRKTRKAQNISARYIDATVERALGAKMRTARPTKNHSPVLLRSNTFVLFVPFLDNIVFS